MDLKHLKNLTTLNEAGNGFFSEAKQYSDSGEFTDEFYDLFAQVTKMKKVMKHPKWIEYMRATDRNSDTMTEGSARDAIKAITDLEDNLKDIDREFDRLNMGETQVDRRQPIEKDDE
jgi:hypothetical protein